MSFALLFALAACGASDTDGDNLAGTDAGEVCVPVADTEVNCTDGKDDNCDDKIDCENVECAFEPTCTGGGGNVDGCGEATYSGDPLPIPDGDGVYETSVSITGFDQGQTLLSADGFVSACVTMEHSWLRDLQIDMVCPSGEVVALQNFLGAVGNSIFMGEPIDNEGVNPTPGVGYEYCWTMAASNLPMLEWANANPQASTLPAGDYRPNDSYDGLVGCTLNGDWTIRALDDWRSDNGYIFEWRVTFSTDIIPDCSDWID